MTNHDPFAAMRLLEAAFKSAGHGIIPMASASRPNRNARFVRKIAVDGHAIIGLDVTLDVEGRLYLIEANGSNMGATSLGDPEGDLRRAEHQIEAALPRLMAESQGSILVAYADNTGLRPEIMARAFMIHNLLLKYHQCQFGDADFNPSAPFVVVADTVERIARHITMKDGQLFYRGKKIISASNTNILPELVRNGVISRQEERYSVNYLVFHDGRLAPLAHDKGAQQKIAKGTGFTPMRWQACQTADEVITSVMSFMHNNLPAVIKPNATSGGVIEFCAPNSTEVEIQVALDRLFQDVRRKYGSEAEKSVWPIRVFEFVQSTPYPVNGAAHLWDMRVACLIRPGEVEMTICGLRLCPEPFACGQISRSTACSNTTGRDSPIKRIRSPLAEDNKATELLRAAGVSDAMLDRIIDTCAAWCQAAWCSSSGAGKTYSREETLACASHAWYAAVG